MQIDHNNADAIDMLRTVRAQQQLDQTHNGGAGAPNQIPSDLPVNPRATPLVPISDKRLTDADINSIRQHEILPGEEIPVQISADLRRKMAARVGMTYDAFSAQSPTQQLQQILDKGDADMKAAAKVGRDPLAILTFKREILPMVLRNCATIGCHGGSAGGSFLPFNKNDTPSTYTNFYIMEQFSMKTAATGFFGSGDRKMIERGDGVHSLFIAFGLPAGQSDVSHPKVPNSSFNGIFRGPDDKLAQQAIQWMNHGLNTIEPSYGISYTPPTGATTQPTTLP
jgi:hypothetical protein